MTAITADRAASHVRVAPTEPEANARLVARLERLPLTPRLKNSATKRGVVLREPVVPSVGSWSDSSSVTSASAMCSRLSLQWRSCAAS
jgi:hypothetical protein